MLLTAWNIKISSGFIAKLWSPLVPLECEPQVPVLSPLRDRRMWFKKKHETKQKTIIGVFFHLPSVKLGSWSLLPLLSLFEDKGLSYYLQRTFIDFFFFYNASLLPKWPFWRWLWIFLVETWNSTCLGGSGSTNLFFLICLSLSVSSDGVFRVLITTLFMVSEISGLGTGTRLKSLACQTEIHF